MDFTRKDILRQLQADLIGKDSYRGVTLTYSWLANQFGHFSLGFIPTFILYKALIRWTHITHPSVVAPIIVSIAWLLFELYNFLKPLLFNQPSKHVGLLHKKYVFEPDWRNIAFDTFTDLCFFWTGAFTAAEICHAMPPILIVIGVVVLLIIPFSRYWYVTKMYLQTAEYPFQFRLSQWNASINDKDKETVYSFVENKEPGKHLFVFGSRRSGKTSISVGIGTEMSIKHHRCSYVTAMKLYSLFFEPDAQLMEEKKGGWTWRKASYLIIDDINPGDPIQEELVDPDKFCAMLDTNRHNEVNREAIKNKNVIWVLGNEDRGEALFSSWCEMLENLGVKRENIFVINLLPNQLD